MAAPSNEVEVAPLRSLDDFLLESARFQLPNLKDLEKWNNRVVQNLNYYQTNYFLGAAIIFVLVTLLHPVKVFSGMVAVAVGYGLFQYITNNRMNMKKFKKEHPFFTLGVIVIGSYFIIYMMGSVLIFLFGLMLPILLVFAHASMRLRNMKNKLSNKIETIGFKKTPMGILLEALGQCQEPEMLKKLEKKLEKMSPIN